MKGYLLEALQNRLYLYLLGTHPLRLSQDRSVGNLTLCAKPFSVVWYSGDFILFFLNTGTDAKTQTLQESC